MKKAVLLVTSLFMVPIGHGATLAVSDLPYSFFSRFIQGEFQLQIIDGALQSSFETDGFAAYPYLSESGVGFLLDYDVAEGSSWFGGSGAGGLDLGGSVFVGLSMVNDLNTGGHEVDLYFDELIPDIASNFFFSGLPYTTMIVDGDAFATGQATYSNSGDPDYLTTGNMNFGGIFGDDAPFICVECSLNFEFNFLYLDFSNGVLSFNPDDPRSDLIFARDSFYGISPYGWDLDINARNVPVPGAFILMISALTGFAGLARRRRAGF